MRHTITNFRISTLDMVVCVLAIALGCTDPKPDPPPTPPAVPTTATSPKPTTPPAITEVEKKPLTFSMRLAVFPPNQIDANDRTKLVTLKPLVTINGQAMSTLDPPQTLRDAREGVAILLLIGGGNVQLHCQGARALLKSLGPRDRVAVGVITNKGFQMVAGFSADMQGAESALKLLENAKDLPERQTALRTQHALNAAVQIFHGRSLPALRAIVLGHDSQHDHAKRSSQMKRQATRLQRLFNVENVRLYTIAPTSTESDISRWQSLSQATSGAFATIPNDDGDLFADRVGDTFRKANHTLRQRIIITVDVPKTIDITNELDITVAFPHQSPPSQQRRLVAPLETQGKVPVIDMNIGPALAPPLPPGVDSGRDLAQEARQADESQEVLLAGVLWKLAQQSDVNNRTAERNANIAMAKHQAPDKRPGTIRVNAEDVPIDVPVEVNLSLVGEILTQWMGENEILKVITQDRAAMMASTDASSDPSTESPDSSLTQVVLHRCVAWTIQDCLRRLLLKDSLTHFVIGMDGKTVQVVDIAQAVRHHEALTPNQIAIHFLLPPPSAPYFQNPDDPTSWRHPRTQKTSVEINGVFQSGWSLSQAQYQSLVPLLHGLTTHFPKIQPALPINMQRRETFAALDRPSQHHGIVNHSNLGATVATCPGPGIDLSRLGSAVPNWQWVGQSLDLEQWIHDLQGTGKREGAMARLALVGDVAVPILTEVIQEGPEPVATQAMEALGHVGHSSGAPVLAQQLSVGWNQDEVDLSQEQNRWRTALHALTRTGTRAQVPAVREFLRKLTATDTAQSSHTWPPLLTDAIATLAVLAQDPGDVIDVVPLLVHRDTRVRANALLTILLHDPDGAKTHAEALMNDENPWVRLLAARARGSEAISTLHNIRHSVAMESVIRGLVAITPDDTKSKALGWYHDSKSQAYEREALRRLYVQRKWAKAVPILAKHLPKAKGTERILVLQALRSITGRDFGSSKEGWLRWRPQKRAE